MELKFGDSVIVYTDGFQDIVNSMRDFMQMLVEKKKI